MASPVTVRAVEKYLGYFAELRASYDSTHAVAFEMYKHTEPDCLADVFERLWKSENRGLEFLTEMVHGLVWGQCLGNGNHRTAVLVTRTFLEAQGVRLPDYEQDPDAPERFRADVDRWIIPSQTLVRNRGDPRKNQRFLEPDHREKTAAWLQRMLSAQSEALAMIGAQRLMDFFS